MSNYYLYRKAWRFNGAPHQEKKLGEKEWKKLLKKGGLLIRNTYHFDQKEESSFWYLIKDSFGGMEELSSNERNKIRNSNNKLTFNKINFELLRSKGYEILKETYTDYAVSDRKMNETVFGEYLSACQEKEIDYWGVFDNDRLIGFCAVWLWTSDSCEYGVMGILPQYKHNQTYPYYGLFFRMNEYYIGEKHYRYVADGARSITEHSQIQDFLIQNFHFRKAYCQLDIHYQWWMKIAVNVLYPFRNRIPLQRMKAILNMESMRRGEK